MASLRALRIATATGNPATTPLELLSMVVVLADELTTDAKTLRIERRVESAGGAAKAGKAALRKKNEEEKHKR